MLLIKVLNFLSLQLGWFVLVYYHNNQAALAGLLLVIFNCCHAKNFKHVLSLTLLVALIGITNDCLLHWGGFIIFPVQHLIILPAWLIVLWLLFTSTFSSSLSWLINSNLLIQASLGSTFGMVSYLLGARLSALTYSAPSIPAYALHFTNWLFLLPIMAYAYKKLSIKFF
jgi:hypothetical protein